MIAGSNDDVRHTDACRFRGTPVLRPGSRSLLAANWQSVPLPFFRTQCQVILGLLVLAALDGSRSAGMGSVDWILVVAACWLTWQRSVGGWDCLGSARIVTWLIALATAGWLALASRNSDTRGLGVQHGKPACLGFPAGSDACGHASGPPLSHRARHVDRAAQEVCAVHELGVGGTRIHRDSSASISPIQASMALKARGDDVDHPCFS